MNLDISLNKISHDDLIELYKKTKEYITELENEIDTSEVEKNK